MLNKNEVYMMDCIEGMKLLEDNSIDIIVADPPYNLSKGVIGVGKMKVI